MKKNMRRLAAATLSSFGLVLGSALVPAHGQSRPLHDIPWYMANDAARSATINLCRNDHRFARDVDCLNAETAEDRLWGQRAARGALPGQRLVQGRSPSSMLDDVLLSPQYWADNRLARIGTLSECKTALTRYPPDVCAAARQGDALDTARRSRP